MDCVQMASNVTATDRINSALATLRSEMLDLRQQDAQLMQQLMCMNDNIKTLTKRRPTSGRQRKTKFTLLNGRRKYINLNESIPEEDSSSADSDSDDSVSGNDN